MDLCRGGIVDIEKQKRLVELQRFGVTEEGEGDGEFEANDPLKGVVERRRPECIHFVLKELMCGCTVSLVSDFIHELNAVGSQTTLNGRWSLQCK